VTIVWSPRAVTHLVALRAYIARDNPDAAGRTAATIAETVERLAQWPNLGRPGRVPGTRELAIPGTPYVIPYRLRGARLEIIAVFHGRQKWPPSL
jgi:toxin ParE1/3/4